MSHGSHSGGGKGIRELIDSIRDAAKDAAHTFERVEKYVGPGLGAISLGKDVADVVTGDYSAVSDLVDDGVAVMQTLLGDAYATPIIEAGLLLLDSYSVMCGDPVTPDVGEMLGNGAAAFEQIEGDIKSAEPTGEWTGASSVTYALADSKQATRAADMAKADGKLQRIIADEAEQIGQTRDFIDERGSELHLAILPALAALAPVFEPEGAAVSIAIQIAAVAATVPRATDRMIEMATNASANARDIRAVADDYTAVAGQDVRTGVGWSATGVPDSPGALGSSAPVPPGSPAPPSETAGPAAPSGPPGLPGYRGAPGYRGTPSTPGTPGPAGAGGGAASGGGGASGAVGASSGAAPGAGTGSSVAPVSGTPSPGAPLSSGMPAGGLPGGAPGAGPGLLTSVLGPVAQALSQVGQRNPLSAGEPGAGAAPGALPVQAPVAGPRPGEPAPEGQGAEGRGTEGQGAEGQGAGAGQQDPAKPSRDAEPDGAAGAGPDERGTRAPIHLELDLDPEQLSDPVRLIVDPKNGTQPQGSSA